ncbi:tRNA (adenosine(37)-N6)-dimethylallyltransferase MiaA [Actinomyces minihominis]|uniref:tRNA (adenosine(37)-N6)-dimethylallyltransferase MiaA n=1 Tax=Actinomyces minihominis TaxID=2002838 RepID=UPI000C06B3A4|nr:tRNA (adenosine(37)-N6)-dimethylallyltransferase MiaA [Actinomyces minihominis]
MGHQQTIAVVGPTATGKSDLALDLADVLGGPERVEIINADAMQFYRGMNIGTAKLPLDQRRGYTHHLLDVLDVTEDASVATYQEQGHALLDEIKGRGRQAIVVGGSGLYLRALLDDMQFPPTDSATRSSLEAELDELGSRELHRRLLDLDPEAAQTIGDSNGRRLVRALEVIAITGRPYTASLPRYTYSHPSVQIGLRAHRDFLDPRIERRAETMFREGLVSEVERLVAEGLREGTTARRATGYAQAIAVLEGRMSEAEGVKSTFIATRQLARKQMKWFRRDPRIRWIDVDATGKGTVLERALAALG